MTKTNDSITPKFSEQLAEAARPIFEEALQSEEIKQEIIAELDAFILIRVNNPKSQMVFREIRRALLSDDFEALKYLEVKKV